MQVYLVGGAVRDALLGEPVQDRDWVVVGATPDALLAQGFTPVGRDFPVFLHPRTREEWALARTERKTGAGYHGFQFHAAPDVTLEQDLGRRDLTINAIAVHASLTGANGQLDAKVEPEPEAWATTGLLRDPCGGLADLHHRVLRHVSPSFAEDPVRILRLARLAARWGDFTVDPDTLTLMRAMVTHGEVDHLVPERVWQEVAKGLMQRQPSRMLQVLDDCGALPRLLTLTSATAQVGDQLDGAAELDAPLAVRAALLGPQPRLRQPADCVALATLLARNAAALLEQADAAPEARLELLRRCDALRQPARFQHLLLALRCRLHVSPDATVATAQWQAVQTTLQQLDIKSIAAHAYAAGLRGPSVGLEVRKAQLAALAALADSAGHGARMHMAN